MASACLHQGGAGGPRRDVQHVGAVNQVKRLSCQHPFRCHDIQHHRALHIRQTLRCRPAGNAVHGIRHGIAGLPCPRGQGCRKPGHMLPRARGNFKRPAMHWQKRAQDIKDDLLVAVCGGAEGGLGHGVIRPHRPCTAGTSCRHVTLVAMLYIATSLIKQCARALFDHSLTPRLWVQGWGTGAGAGGAAPARSRPEQPPMTPAVAG